MELRSGAEANSRHRINLKGIFMKPTKYNRTAFTLVELLVVISIIALLLAILMPSLQRAREQAKMIMCRSNQKELYKGIMLYAVSNDGRFEVADSFGNLWYHKIALYMGDDKYAKTMTGPARKKYLDGGMAVMYCPSTKRSGDHLNRNGTYQNTWFYQSGEGSFGINCFITPKFGGFDYYKGKEYYFPSGDKIGLHRGDIPVFGDSSWLGGWPMNTKYFIDPVPSEFYTGDPQRGDGMTRYCINRHKKGINISFVGGDVRKVEIPELWYLKWNNLSKKIKMPSKLFKNLD